MKTTAAVAALAAAVATVLAGAAQAAQVFVQPLASVTAESDSNLDLDPTGGDHLYGYLANAASVIGIATPLTTTTIRPQIDYRNYPNDAEDNRVEEQLDFNSYYKSVRTTAGIFGSFDHRDLFSAELASATYNPTNPNQPTSPETGRTVRGATRESGLLVPSYGYHFTSLFGMSVSGIYQKVNYSPNDSVRFVNFDYYQGKVAGTYTLSQRTDLSLGVYGSKYEATRFDSRASAGGASVDWSTNWSPLWTTQASVSYQKTSIYSKIPPTFDGQTNAWGASFSAIYKNQTSGFRTDLGRVITPSGGGTVYINDQFQAQYDRNLTQRLTLTGAAIYRRNRAITSNASGDGRNYVRTDIDLKWMMTRTLYLQGGYQYFWQKYELDPEGAANNRVYIRFGYEGLGRQY